jgi:hypothetical protein
MLSRDANRRCEPALRLLMHQYRVTHHVPKVKTTEQHSWTPGDSVFSVRLHFGSIDSLRSADAPIRSGRSRITAMQTGVAAFDFENAEVVSTER